MIDAREPKNGDYASYLEGLVGKAPGAVPAGRPLLRGPGRDPGARRRGGAAGSPDAAVRPSGADSRRAAAEGAQAAIGAANGAGGRQAGIERGPAGMGRPMPVTGALRQAALFSTMAGIALIGLSLLDDPPFFADAGLGILLVAVGAFINRFVRKRS